MQILPVLTAQYKIKQLDAELASAKQDVRMMKTDVEAATQKVVRTKRNEICEVPATALNGTWPQKAAPEDSVHQWNAKMDEAAATVKVATADAERARLRYRSKSVV